MREKFAKEFITKLNGKISEESLKTVFQELELFVNDYDIESRKTEIVPYDDYIPRCYAVYLISKKIEGKSAGTLKLYDICLRDFFAFSDTPIENMKANDIRVYLYSLQQRRKISNHTLDERRLIINAFMQWCATEGYIERNPCMQVSPIKFEFKPRIPLNGIELELIRDACKTYREKAIIELLYSTGCRVTELQRLNINDINFDTREVCLFGKGNKHRTSYLNAKSEVCIKKYLNERTDENEALFVGMRNPYRRLSKTGIEYIVGKIGKRAGISRNIYPHLIRHTTATDAINRGMSVAEVQKILGHEKLNTTMIYAKISEETIKYNHKRYIV